MKNSFNAVIKNAVIKLFFKNNRVSTLNKIQSEH